MRLTLRTLLAYLDDRLSSANAREIGKKLNDSAFAQDLADRIRTVMRQRRLSAPGRKVKLIDPNLIAEYLDDQLTPELVSLIEKEVLSSDFSLAEVAASHEIIALLGDPVDLAPRLRERLSRQNPSPSQNESTDYEFEKVSPKKISDPVQEVWKPLAPQRTFLPRSPALILAALLVGWLALLLTDNLFMTSSQDITSSEAASGHGNIAEVENQRSKDEDPIKAESKQHPTEDSGSGSEIPNVENNGLSTDSEVSAPVNGILSAAGSESVADPGNTPDTTTDSEPVENQVTLSSDESVVPNDDDIATTVSTDSSDGDRSVESKDRQAVDEPVHQKFEFLVDDPHEMLLSRSLKGNEWMRAAVIQTDGSNTHALVTDHISALPDPFISQITPVGAGWSATLVSPCLVQFDDGVWPELRLYDGRCIVLPEQLNAGAGTSILTLVAGGTTVNCSLAGDDLRLGILVVPERPVSPESSQPDPNNIPVPETGENQQDSTIAEDSVENETERLPLDGEASVVLYMAGGSLVVKADGIEDINVGKGRAIQWTTAAGSLQGIHLSDPGQLDAIPDWVFTAGETAVIEIEATKSKFAVDLKQSESIIDRAQQLCEVRDPLQAKFAASVLSVSREVDILVQVLLQTDEEQVRIETINGLRNAAAQTLPGRRAVMRALENRLPMRDLGHFVRLFEGVTRAEAQDEETSVWLVTMLRHNRAPIRQMAYMTLLELTGQIRGYHPDSPSGQRNDSVRRWERLLKSNGNRILVPQ
ncbi:MAG: hypothetical protein MK102_11110 [Fuerstiella sp.]|nr:hypothetical protein [Fuerstiella sp.]